MLFIRGHYSVTLKFTSLRFLLIQLKAKRFLIDIPIEQKIESNLLIIVLAYLKII